MELLDKGLKMLNGQKTGPVCIRGSSAQIDWENVSVSVPDKSKKETQILQNITGSAKANEIMAIMGSSGAGKSTFMNVLTRRNIKGLQITGRVAVNGVEVKEDISKISAYIQQNDVFVGALTVKEHLLFHAKLKLSKESPSRRSDRVQEVVKIMGLQNCYESEIGTPGLTKTISGGEMKRLSIAVEILTDPLVIFADEPTSGLDAYLAMSVVSTLKELARNGTTILCTIHQPSSAIFDVFDSLQLLSLGRCMYNGPKDGAKEYFASIGYPCRENYNPADHYIWETSVVEGQEEECRERIKNLENSFSKSEIYEKIVTGQSESIKEDPLVKDAIKEWERNRVGVCMSFIWLLWRSSIVQYRDKSTMGMKFGQNLGTALIVGLVYLRIPWSPNDAPYTNVDTFNINGAIFSAVCSFSFSYLFLVVFSFPRMQIVLRREYYDGLYYLLTAFLAEIFAGLPFLLVMPGLFIGIQYCMIGLFPSGVAFGSMYFTCILIAASATGYGYMISAIAPSVEAANAMAPPLMVPLLLFGGFFLQSDSVRPYFIWLKYLSWFYYGAENLYVTQWHEGGACVSGVDGVPELRTDGVPVVEEGSCIPVNLTDCSCLSAESEFSYHFVPGDFILDTFGYKVEHYWRNVGCLIALAVGFRMIAYFVLSFKFRKANR